MLNEEICKARERLNESIITGKNYQEIYKLSVELDELIARYYLNNDTKENSEEEKI
ncbi:MAG: aspartyl-phosphate phosphatase Spo0E family protein [Clostridia bacterium]|nr:aspartyl-phosphate phosphatase Spo0E family protein [Clostridia bacterium]